MFYRQEFGIDLGTDTIKIFDKKTNTVTTEKNLIAIRNGNTVLGAGNEAYEMLGRTSSDTVVMTPVFDGRIRDIRFAEAIIHILLFNQKHYIGYRPSIYFAAPTDMTEIERRAYASIARRGKLRGCAVYLVEKPILDALALGIKIKKAKGSMMINIGASSAYLSAIAESNVILSKSFPMGGQSFDSAIAAAVKKRNMLNISLKDAELLKIKLLGTKNDLTGMAIQGTDAATGLPRNGFVTRATVFNAVKSLIDEMIVQFRGFLERIPPQVRSTVSLEGIYLTGGGSRIIGLDGMLSAGLGYSVTTSSQDRLCTINGLKEVIVHSGANQLIYTPLTLKKK